MRHPNVRYLRAVGLMVGGIVGAGVFGLPYVFAQAGAAVGLLELLVLGVLLLILQLMFVEVVVQTPGKRRLVSYIDHYIGGGWKWVGLLGMSLGVWGAMLAYMVIGGQFLETLMAPFIGGAAVYYSFLLAIVAAFLIFGGLRFASRVEVVVVGVLLFLFVFIVLACLPQVQAANFITVDSTKALLPYGVILFALTGLGIVPEMKDVLGARHKRFLAPAVVTAMALIIGLYVLFALSVVGVTGVATTSTAFAGLIPYLGSGFGTLTALLGSLTILSIYMVLGVELLNTFKFDFRLPHRAAWFLVVAVPITLFALGWREFIEIVGFVGGVFNGLLGILVALCYFVMRRSPVCTTHHCINFPAPLTWALIGIFAVGIIVEVVVSLM